MTFDSVLTLLGAVLIAFGLFLIIANRGKARAEGSSNKVEAFGIKIDVSNPSVLLILLGVGLVLVPRFYPAPEGMEGEMVVSQSAPDGQPVEPVAAPQAAPAAASPETFPALPDAPTAAGPQSKPQSKQPREVPRERPAGPRAPEVPPVASAPPARPAVVDPPATPVPEPRVWVLVDAEVSENAGITGISREEYSSQLRSRLAGVASALFGAEQISHAGDQAVAREGVDAICRAAPTPKVLLAAVDIPDEAFSAIESAYWPLLRIKAINCNDGRVQTSGVTRLTPKRTDKLFFEQDFVSAAERFVASRSYFLK